jgi:hypothetical protein
MGDGPQGGRGPRPEPTFADVMNGFSFDTGRAQRRRKWRKRRGEPQPEVIRGTPMPTGPIGVPVSQAVESSASAVRPYSWTRGRTRPGYDLAVETLVSTSPRGRDQVAVVQLEHRAVAELCTQTRSVAEIAALLPVPLGVARVLLGDMAALGLVVVHQRKSSNGDLPDLALMERVLSGLRRL